MYPASHEPSLAGPWPARASAGRTHRSCARMPHSIRANAPRRDNPAVEEGDRNDWGRSSANRSRKVDHGDCHQDSFARRRGKFARGSLTIPRSRASASRSPAGSAWSAASNALIANDEAARIKRQARGLIREIRQFHGYAPIRESGARSAQSYGRKSICEARLARSYARKSICEARLAQSYARKSICEARLAQSYARKLPCEARVAQSYARKSIREARSAQRDNLGVTSFGHRRRSNPYEARSQRSSAARDAVSASLARPTRRPCSIMREGSGAAS